MRSGLRVRPRERPPKDVGRVTEKVLFFNSKNEYRGASASGVRLNYHSEVSKLTRGKGDCPRSSAPRHPRLSPGKGH